MPGLVAAILLALHLAPVRGLAQAPSAESYERAIEGYFADRESALRTVAAWPEESLWKLALQPSPRRDGRFRTTQILLLTELTLARLAQGDREDFTRRIGRIESLDESGVPDRFRASWQLAVGAVYLRLGAPREAERHFGRGLDVDRTDPELLVALGASHEQHASQLPAGVGLARSPRDTLERQKNARYAEAVGLYDRAVAADPECADAHLRLAWAHFRDGRPEKGRDEVDWVLHRSSEPDHLYVAHLLFGRDRERTGHLEDAAASYRRALEADPRGGVAHLALSQVLSRIGDRTGAVASLRQALSTRDETDYVDAWQSHDQGRDAWLQVAGDELVQIAERMP